MKMAVFWVVAPCSLVALMMEAARTSETLVNFYQITRRYNLKDSHLRTHRRENLKSYILIVRFDSHQSQLVGKREIILPNDYVVC
jgi:hypothetical protein